MEVEVKGPVVALAAAGGNYTFVENWWAAKVRAPILDVDSVGAIAKRLSYNSTTQSLTAIYGVFYQGTAKADFFNAQGQLLLEGLPHTVSPLIEFQLQDIVSIPDSAKTIEVRIYNTKDELMGVLEKKDISALLTGIKNGTSKLPTKFGLEQNYPNPFNPTTVLSYRLPVTSNVTLKVYDILGKEVATLVDETKSAGSYEVKFDASNLSSGIYFYKLQSGRYTETKKLVLMK
jgi:hypothetical protein